jgi:phytoene desaturase
MSNKSDTLIVGGGLGGLATAIRLAARGQRVTVLEKNERVGGKLNVVEAEGYYFDTGPSLFTMPWVIEELFASAGRDYRDYLMLEQIEPTCRYRWRDGSEFNAWQRLPQLVQEVERIAPGEAENLFRFLAYGARIYDAVADTFLLRPFGGIADVFTPQMLRNGPRIDALRTVDAAVQAHFRSPYLRQVFNRYATYNGSSPYRSPATFNVISYIEVAEGGWYVKGGMYRIAEVLQQLGAELGVCVRTQSEVTKVLLQNKRAYGVQLRDGRELTATQVVINADPRYAYEQLLPHQGAMAQRLRALEASCSGFMLLLGVDRVFPQLAHHNIFFSDDYASEFRAIFDKGVPAVDPTIYVAASCVSDPEHAPVGHMNLFVLVNAPSLNQRLNWQCEARAYRDLVLAKLERMGLRDLARSIVFEQMWTPEDIAQRYNAADGAIYGLASNNPFAAFMRPPLRVPGLQQLYFVGGGTHPGGGIPLVLLSGKAVAEQIIADRASL